MYPQEVFLVSHFFEVAFCLFLFFTLSDTSL